MRELMWLMPVPFYAFEARSNQSSPFVTSLLYYTMQHDAYNIASYECLNAQAHTHTHNYDLI